MPLSSKYSTYTCVDSVIAGVPAKVPLGTPSPTLATSAWSANLFRSFSGFSRAIPLIRKVLITVPSLSMISGACCLSTSSSIRTRSTFSKSLKVTTGPGVHVTPILLLV
eukprot:1940952-Amphidinium_carterae.1